MLGPRNMGAGTLTVPTTTKYEDEDYFSYGSKRHQGPFHDSAKPQNVTPPRFYSGNANVNSKLPDSSAKRLISQYERMSTPPAWSSGSEVLMKGKSTKRRQYVHDYRAGFDNLQMPGVGISYAGGGISKKEKSPIRQSLRNLLSVFRKGAGLTKKKGEDEFSELPDGHDSIGTLQKRKKGTANAAGKSAGLTINLDLAEKAKIPASSPKTTTGSLFYLTRILRPGDLDLGSKPVAPVDNAISSAPLAWTTCNVTLDSTLRKFHLSSFTSDLEFVVHEIHLTGCTDIRSISVSQLSETEAKLLDEASVGSVGEPGKLKVFEITFVDGRSKERFAAKSVKERAGWVSAIWDVILPGGTDMDAKVLQTTVSLATSQASHQGQSTPIESPTPIRLPRMSNLLSSSRSQRSLPPIPPEKLGSISPPEETATTAKKASKRPITLHLDIPDSKTVLSPRIYLPTFRTSLPRPALPSPIREPRPLLLSNSTSRSSTTVIRPTPLTASTYPTAASRPPSILGATSPPVSPSIVNLSQLSMVRQRLAKIERNHSQISSQSGYSDAITAPTPVTAVAKKSETRASRPRLSPGSLKSASLEIGGETPQTPDTVTSIGIPEATTGARSADTEKNSTPQFLKPQEERSDTSHSPKNASKRSQVKRDKKENPSKARLTKEDIEDLSTRIAEVKGTLGGESGYPTIHQVVLGLEDRTQDNKRMLKTMQERIDELGGCLKDVLSSTAALSSAGNEIGLQKGIKNDEIQDSVIRAIEDVKTKLISEFPPLHDKFQELQSAQVNLLEKIQDKEQSNVPPTTPRDVLDLKPVVDKLDELTLLLQASQKTPEEAGVSEGRSPILENVEKVLSIVQEESHKQILFSQQQAESVRYLNELNNWLETFVNDGTSQIQGLSVNIEQLCRALGCDSRQPGVPGAGLEGSSPNLLSDIRQLVTGMQARDRNFAALQAAVHSLLEVLSSSQTQMGAESQAIAGLITRQRREQEALLRTFTSEISGEIKGERLRFVEAMKEATAINVQLHVEHFKQDLNREVMAMTEEVGRLHREKQIIENQISDLFAFYSKHKQSAPQHHSDTLNITQGREQPRANIPRSYHRPLPYPGSK